MASIHILEPHWNKNKIEQVIGRGIRYKSHKGDKTVHVYVDHADANAAFNIAVWPLIDPLHTERDVCKGSTDAPQCGVVISSRKAA